MSSEISRLLDENAALQATIEELQFEHYRGWSSQKLYREEAEAGRATIEELKQGIRDHSDLTHKSNCQTQEGQHGGLNRAYWCSCCLEERKKIESQQATIEELRSHIPRGLLNELDQAVLKEDES